MKPTNHVRVSRGPMDTLEALTPANLLALCRERDALRAQIAATTAELFDALALLSQIDRRGRRSTPLGVVYGQRRSDHDFHTPLCQCRGDEPGMFSLDLSQFFPS